MIERTPLYRALEMLPGALTWSALTLPVVLSLVFPVGVAYFIIVFDLYWLFKSVNMSRNLLRGYRALKWAARVDWQKRLELLPDVEKLQRYVMEHTPRRMPGPAREDLYEVQMLSERGQLVRDPGDLLHLLVIPTYQEELSVLESTFEALTATTFPLKRIMVVLAVDESRPNPQGVANADILKGRYGDSFYEFMVTRHPASPGEVRGKGPNITYAGRAAKEYLESQGFSYEDVIVTTLDADHRPHARYLSYLTYKYCVTPNPETKSFQPMQLASNNIWDAPAAARLVAFGTSFWLLVESSRARRLKNYSTHAQSLQALVDTDFWSVTTIVEDGHQYWRTYFTYNGDHKVVPLFVPIYIDAVLSRSYWKTIKAQYIQLRRWAWGASDIPFVITGFLRHREIPLSEKIIQTARLLEGHFTWATASLYLSVVAWLPLLLNEAFRSNVLAYNLGPTASRILTLAMIGLITSVFISVLLLPKRPPHRGPRRHAAMYLQWLLMPVFAIFFSSFPAIDAQTRLLLGRYMEKFDVTEKVRRSKVTQEAV